jgi:hypothetical protein
MRAAGPAARPALSLHKPRARPLDPPAPCFRLFGILDPADPLITRERRNILPRGQRSRVGRQGLAQIIWCFVYYAGGDVFFGHGVSVWDI